MGCGGWIDEQILRQLEAERNAVDPAEVAAVRRVDRQGDRLAGSVGHGTVFELKEGHLAPDVVNTLRMPPFAIHTAPQCSTQLEIISLSRNRREAHGSVLGTMEVVSVGTMCFWVFIVLRAFVSYILE